MRLQKGLHSIVVNNDLSGQNGRPGKRMLSQNILASGPKMQTEISSASTTIKVPIILEFPNLNVNKELIQSHITTLITIHQKKKCQG